jgi:hypothetical protein
VDKPSAGIPAAYVMTGLLLGEALSQRGEGEAARGVLATAESVARASRTTDWFGVGQAPPLPAAGDAAPRLKVPVEAAPKSTP